jgi:hypothetical protein
MVAPAIAAAIGLGERQGRSSEDTVLGWLAGLLRNFGGDLMRRDLGTLEYEVGLGRARHLLRIR